MATKKDFKKNITDDKLKNDDIILPEILENIIDEITYNVFKDIKSEKNKPIEDFLSNCSFHKNDNYWFYSMKEKFTIPEYLMVSVE